MAFYESEEVILADRQLALQQGDILCPVPFSAGLASSAQVMRGEVDSVGTLNATDLTRTGGDLGSVYDVLVSVELGIGIIVTQTCDLERKDRPITVARVRPFNEFHEVKPGSKGFFERLKTLSNPGRAPNQFLWPGCNARGFSMEYSLVSLLELQTFSHGDLDAFTAVVRMRLSAAALGAFQERITFCFARRAIPEDLYVNDDVRAESERQAQRWGNPNG